MKQKLLLFCLVFFSLQAFAQDKTFEVKVHQRTHLENDSHDYSQRVLFPVKGKKIKDITLLFSLNCPEKKCSDWDYSINIVLRKIKGTDTLNYQLGRMITPYSGWYNQGENTLLWDYKLKWNITEYLPLMYDSVDIVLSYEGFQDGFLASTDFIFTQADKNEKVSEFLGVENVCFGYFPYGRTDSAIEDFLPKKTVYVPKGTKKILSRMTVSGHGGDAMNAAAEFLEKHYLYSVNNRKVAYQSVWKDDCGCNPVQPQGGTWIYNRAGWCPGTKVNEYYYDLTPYVKDGKIETSLSFDYYNGNSSGQAGYRIANDIFFIKDENYEHKTIEDKKYFVNDTLCLPKDFLLVFKTNADARDKWCIASAELDPKIKGGFVLGKKFYEQSQFDTDKIYTTKVSLPKGENFLLRVEDNDCDGMSWWANPDQKDGYVLLYDKDSSTLLHVFEPDFGCYINQPIKTMESNYKTTHKNNHLVALQDNDLKTFRVLFFCAKEQSDKMEIVINDRKTGEEVYRQSYDSADKHDITIDIKDWKPGYYRAKIVCNGFSESKMLTIR